MKEIRISGCDDTTYITENDWGRDFTKDEIKVFIKIELLSRKKAEYMCQPVFYLREVEE